MLLLKLVLLGFIIYVSSDPQASGQVISDYIKVPENSFHNVQC
jgi:hypothetical protein